MTEPYLERHYPENQNKIKGIIINPDQRWDFDITPNEDRPEKEINDWFNVMYIRTQGFIRDTYLEYIERTGETISKQEWTNKREQEKERWYKWYPTGYRYNVRCLDEGAWDRSTNLGAFPSLEGAIEFIEST